MLQCVINYTLKSGKLLTRILGHFDANLLNSLEYSQYFHNSRRLIRVVYKSRRPAKFAGFSARFRRLLSLLHESKYVEEMDPQPSTFHKTPAT